MKKQDRKPEVFTGLRSCVLSEIVGAAVAVTGGNAAEMAVQLPVLCRVEGETRLGRVETVSACGREIQLHQHGYRRTGHQRHIAPAGEHTRVEMPTANLHILPPLQRGYQSTARSGAIPADKI